MKAVKELSFKEIIQNLNKKKMNKKLKAFLYNLLGFLPFYVISYLLLQKFTGLSGFWIPLSAAVITTILAPKFQMVKYMGEEKIYMKWLFLKNVKEVK